jgi:hypothetical protein
MSQNSQIETKRRNGLQVLAELGVPDGALTTFLVVLATLTVLPYIAGREFGPYSIPDVLPGGIFWTLTIVTPLLWVILVVQVFGADWQQLKRTAIGLAIVEIVAIILAFGSMTITETKQFEASLAPGEPKSFKMTLPAVNRVSQQLTLTVTRVEGLSPTFHDVGVMICGMSENTCAGGYEQVSIDTPMSLLLKKGDVQIWVYNYPSASGTAQVTLQVKYLRRRYL